MVNKCLRASENHGRGQAESIKSTLFEGLLTSKMNNRRFHYVREFGFDGITKTARLADMPAPAQTLLQILFRYNIQHKFTPRGLRIAITPNLWRIASNAGRSL
jgi:hypothetical protein